MERVLKINGKVPIFFLKKKEAKKTHTSLIYWTASRRPEVPSLKLIQVPSHNSAKFFQNFLSRLAGSRAKVLGRHNRA